MFIAYSTAKWYSAYQGIVINGDTRKHMFWGVQGGPDWIWRCYHVWGRSFRTVSGLLAFVSLEAALCIVATLSDASYNDTFYNIYDYIVGALIFISFVTTVITTFMIGFKIYRASQFRGSPYRKLFNNITVILIESAAPYSIILLLESVTSFIPSYNVFGSKEDISVTYMDAAMSFITGIAPTVLVARVALISSETVISRPPSNL
ncbi:hypothetical protein JR316_0008623 [Psilocybe cubensis]|uniref:Uncharacterized protein n=1 Tax=Psilocybe cubensis TaxID=181762 RepID=A0ACB8GRR8_PSICU|nr:hypothetical protein JR316_0008623 [Psilocybe cubensis]KAH9478170.1 hypothetical protein JR316_0008623 [Psilocybe cubensis]